MASIEELLAQLGAMNYQAPSSYTGYQSGFKPVDRSLPDWKPSNFKQSDFESLKKEEKKKGSGINLWDVLSGTLGQPSGLTTTSAYKAAEKLLDKDTPIWEKVFSALNPISVGAGEGIKNGGKQQWKNWTDGKLSWGDIPSVGFLHGADKGWKRGSNILEDFFDVDNRWGKVGGGIAIDIAADPLTYLTGGVSAATKLRKVAEVAEISNQAKNLGIAGKFKNTAQFQEAAEAAIRAKYAKYPNLVDKMVTKKMDEITNAIKTSANKAYNTNINKMGMGVPFTSKMVLGDMKASNPLYRTEANVSSSLVQDLLQKAAKGNATHAVQLENLVKSRYGVNSLEELTKTQFDDLHKLIQPFTKSTSRGLPEVTATSNVVTKAMPEADFTRLMEKFVSDNVPWKDVQKQLDEILKQMPDAKTRASMGSHLAEMVAKYWGTKPAKNFSGVANARKSESMTWASKFLKESDEYQTVQNTVTDILPKGKNALSDKEFYKNMASVNKNPFNEMMNGRTKFEHWLDSKNPFDTRTLNTGDKFLNSMGDEISNAQSQRIGETAQYGSKLENLKKFVKDNKITKEHMEQAIYVIEKHAPDHLGGSSFKPSSLVQKLADEIRPIIDEIGKNEQAGGVLEGLRKNYFPHVVNKSTEIIDEVDDFLKRHKEFNNLKGTNKFNQMRKGFQTLAQRDNYIKKIEKAIQKETDPAKIEILQRQQEHVADLFDTDVVSALQRRVKEGTRAKAMKAMQGELSKFGMMKTITKGSKDSPPSGLKELEPEVAKKLGLGEGKHYMHPEILKSLERVDEVFTNQNMNKAARMVSAIGDIWRPLVTYYKPAHYINNMIGNTMNNIVAGVRPKDVTSAVKLMKGYRSGKLSESELKIMKSAYKHNVISGGFLFDSKATFEFDQPDAIEKFAKFIGENKGISWVRKKGEVIDDWSRLANFINGIDKYGSAEKAAEQVRKYLFNYNELTNADRNMRVVVPFWNWTKRNLPLQLKLLQEKPQFALNVERFKNLFNDEEKGEDWQKESGIKILGMDYYTGLPSPTHDLGMVLNPKQFLSSTTPAVKMPLEVNFNRKIYTGNPISYGSDSVQSEDMLDYIMSNLGVGNNAYQAATGDKTAFENIMGMLRPVSKIREE
jgi:methionine salvage enolase-phosphatase E1